MGSRGRGAAGVRGAGVDVADVPEVGISAHISCRYGSWKLVVERTAPGNRTTISEEKNPTPERLIEVASTLHEDVDRAVRDQLHLLAEEAERRLAVAHKNATDAAARAHTTIQEEAVRARIARDAASRFPPMPEARSDEGG